jgi:hypothetical protein
MGRLCHRSVRALVAAAIATVAAAFAAAPAVANQGDVYFGGDGMGKCQQELNLTLSMWSPTLTVYGFPSTDHVRVWYRVVDDYGRPQSEWGDRGTTRATATTPAMYATITLSRGMWKQWSRFQFLIAWYAIDGQTGTVPPVSTRYVTLSSYHLYSFGTFGGLYPQLYFQGNNTACFG